MARTKASETSRFQGFADPGARFFHALARNQNREWFLAHKHEYERGWLEPMKALLDEVWAEVHPSFRTCELAEPKVFRIFRDVRFSRDKSPYKTHVAGFLPLASPGKGTSAPAALYLHLGTDTYVGAGQWMMEPEQLERYRAAVIDERTGRPLGRILAKLEKEGFVAGAHETLKKVPRGVDPEHPRAALTRHKGLVVEFPKFPRKLVVSAEFVDWLVAATRRAAPLVEWLATATRP